MCCLFSLLCQQHQQCHRAKFAYLNRHSAAVKLKVCLFFVVLLLNLTQVTLHEIPSQSYLSELRVQELHNIAIRLEHSIDADKSACESYFDYVCGRNRPLFSVMGHLPDNNELIHLLTELQEDPEQFEAKQKLMDFFISCNSIKSLDDCYRESFEYFKPLFGYLISKNYLDNAPEELETFLNILDRFIRVADQNKRFRQEPTLLKLTTLKTSFRYPQTYFRSVKLNKEYETLKIYRESYQHNIKNLEVFRKRNSTYTQGTNRIVLDWTLYLYQSRHKPISYYYPTFNTHLWMSVYNRSEVREYEPKRFAEIGECLKLPQFVNALEEARILTIVYLKSFYSAWKDYVDWISSSPTNGFITEQENQILAQYQLNNEKLFFTLYAQNFCEFGRDLAENVFFVGLKHSLNFTRVYSCNYRIDRNYDCL
uniref:Peptidase M13 N-terminal domain-containing protein n=1 Tax=Musca domestica TaxID=7370 RepID=A0A1I8NJD5_MUSDO